ncbi:hypothetical protein [Saccharopolyspora shandongensis]|uniref:hypothetical protein n=1 Tax=Saccharopolyspora shandongensis TaxID=418495 RepID=UPI0033F50269
MAIARVGVYDSRSGRIEVLRDLTGCLVRHGRLGQATEYGHSRRRRPRDDWGRFRTAAVEQAGDRLAEGLITRGLPLPHRGGMLPAWAVKFGGMPVNDARGLPAKDRPGKLAWLGPVSLCASLISWIVPGGGMTIALAAVACGVISVWTRGAYRKDGTAVIGVCVASLQVAFSLMLVLVTAGGHWAQGARATVLLEAGTRS